jgi:hypothetical protein
MSYPWVLRDRRDGKVLGEYTSLEAVFDELKKYAKALDQRLSGLNLQILNIRTGSAVDLCLPL